MKTEQKIEKLVGRLQKIAKKNNDEFKYVITFLPGIAHRKKFYMFECREREDNHVIIDGYGSTIGEAVRSAEKGVEDACARWNYEE